MPGLTAIFFSAATLWGNPKTKKEREEPRKELSDFLEQECACNDNPGDIFLSAAGGIPSCESEVIADALLDKGPVVVLPLFSFSFSFFPFSLFFFLQRLLLECPISFGATRCFCSMTLIPN